MKDCLDEGTLQSYFDGELSTRAMESATSHLASCAVCSAAARELEQETSLLTSALAAEFEATVPTENLRRRIDVAVAGLNAPAHVFAERRSVGFFSSLFSLLSFSPQRMLGVASLAVMLAFAGILAVIKFRNGDNPNITAQSNSQSTDVASSGVAHTPPVNPPIAPKVIVDTNQRESNAIPQRPVVYKTNKAPVPFTKRPAPVKLIPGERSYLQAIARLDTTIKSEKKAMRPALQVEYERNLAVVDRAIAATRTAAKNNPSDPDAADFMFAAYQSKVDLLNTIADARLGDRSH